jgi:hypothetical protein
VSALGAHIQFSPRRLQPLRALYITTYLPLSTFHLSSSNFRNDAGTQR